MIRRLSAAVLAGAMFVSSSALATGSATQGALAPGKAADVKQAEGYKDMTPLWWVLGGGVIIGGIILVATGDGHGAVGSTTTCPFSGCPTPPPPPPPTTTTTSTTTGT